MDRRERFGRMLICFVLFFSLPGGGPALLGAAESSYPTRPINVVVAYAPGGSADLCSKPVMERMGEFLGQPMISVYKPGGGGSLGAAFVSKAKPDGYTVLLGSSTPLSISPVVKKMDYQLEDFTLIGIFGKGPLWLLVKGDSRWKTLKEFIEEARKNPGKLMVGSYGSLSASHFCIELFSKHAGIKVTHVPYKSSGEAQTAILGGHLDAGLVKGAGGHLESGSLRVLAAATEERLEFLPDIPTFKEFGYPVFANQWNCFCVPKGTAPEVFKRLSDAQKKTMEKYGKQIKEELIRVEYWVELYNPEESMKKFREERESAYRIARELGRPNPPPASQRGHAADLRGTRPGADTGRGRRRDAEVLEAAEPGSLKSKVKSQKSKTGPRRSLGGGGTEPACGAEPHMS